jgi:predicted O-methyltransferase YrrM
MPLQVDAKTEHEIERYLWAHGAEEDEVLQRARERAAAEDMPPVPAEVGAFLSLAARWTRAQNALEFGSGGGISGVWIARGLLPGARLTTIEIDPVHRRLAQQSYKEAGVEDKIESILGVAGEILPTFPDKSFDFIFMDLPKSEYPIYLEEALRLARPGGVIIADNVIFFGRVSDLNFTNPEIEAIRVFNRRIVDDPRLHSMILPIGDGVAVGLVKDGAGLG